MTTCCRRRATRAATSRPPWPRRRMSSAASGRRSASSTCSSSRRRASRARCPTGVCTSTARAKGSSTIAGRSPPSSASRKSGCTSNSRRNGGAFGGKEDMTIQAQTAVLARLTGRPVRIALSREESIRIHPKRHPLTMTYTVGCDAEGRLTAVKADILGDSGAYASVGGKVLERAAGHACGPYRTPAVAIEVGRRLHQQSAVRRDARLRRQPDELRHRGLPRPARRQGRHRRLGDALAQHRAGRRPDDDRTDPGKVGRRREDPARGQAGLRRGARRRARGRHRLRPEELRARQRRDRIRQVPSGRAAGRRGRSPHRLHRDGPGAADRPHAMRGRSHRPARLRSSVPRSTARSRSAPARRPARAPRCSPDARRSTPRRSSRPTSTPGERSPISSAPSTSAKSASTTPPRRAN